MLFDTINVWINADYQVQCSFWGTIKSIIEYNSLNDIEVVSIDSLLQILETISITTPYSSCCSYVNPKENYYLSLRFNPIISLIKQKIMKNLEESNSLLTHLLSLLRRQPCHCLYSSIIKMLGELCTEDAIFFLGLGKLNGFYILCKSALEYSIDIKMQIIELCKIVIVRIKETGKRLRFVICDAERGVGEIFSSLSKELNKKSVCKEEKKKGITLEDLHKMQIQELVESIPMYNLEPDLELVYFMLLNWMFDINVDVKSMKSDNSNKLKYTTLNLNKLTIVNKRALLWILKFTKKAKCENLSIRVLLNLIEIADASKINKIILLKAGVLKWLLNFEEIIYSNMLLKYMENYFKIYHIAIKFHVILLCEVSDSTYIMKDALNLLLIWINKTPKNIASGLVILKNPEYTVKTASIKYLLAQFLKAYNQLFVNLGAINSNSVIWQNIIFVSEITSSILISTCKISGQNIILQSPSYSYQQKNIFGFPLSSDIEIALLLFDILPYFWKDKIESLNFSVMSQKPFKMFFSKPFIDTMTMHFKLFNPGNKSNTNFGIECKLLPGIAILLSLLCNCATFETNLLPLLKILESTLQYSLILLETAKLLSENSAYLPLQEVAAILFDTILTGYSNKLIQKDSKSANAIRNTLETISKTMHFFMENPNSLCIDMYKIHMAGVNLNEEDIPQIYGLISGKHGLKMLTEIQKQVESNKKAEVESKKAKLTIKK